MAARSTQDPELVRLAGDVREAVTRMVRTMRAQRGFPLAQASVLAQLERQGTTSIGELATDAKVRPQSMAQTVRELEELAFVERSSDPADARRVLIDLTDDGRTALDAQRLERDGWLAGLLGELDASERDAVDVAMRALRAITDAE